MKIRHNLLMPIMTLLLAMSPSKALGQAVDVSVEVSNREVYVGEMVTLTITIKNTSSYILPDFEIKGVRIQKDPNPIRSSFTTIQFGKTTTVQSTIHTYRLVTTQAGVFTIPALNVRLGNEIKTTQPIDVMVNTIELQEGDGEKLILEIESDRSTYYLGEPVDATLRIWIMPYRDKQFNLTVSRNDMWGRIKDETSEWGEFSGILQPRQNQLFGGPKPHSAPPDGGESLRAIGGDPNNRRAYYFYELRTTIWPKQAGELNLSDVRILIEYPNRLERRRSGFGHQFVVTKSRLIAAKIAQSPITIKPTPEAGKPTSFSGAVGRYSMTVRAQPTEVTVGDPITLVIDIRDRTGASRLDVLLPPNLEATPELSENFRIPTDPLAGEVVGSTKRFVQTLRAESADVTRIPPIQFAYFDPLREQYVSVESKPIPLIVQPATSLAMTDIIEAPGGPPPSQNGPTQLTQVSGGVLANYGGTKSLLRSHSLTLGWVHATSLLTPPLLVGFIALARRRSERYRTDERFARRRSARRGALQKLSETSKAEPDVCMDLIAEALSGYIADKCHLPAGAHTPRALVQSLRDGAIPDQLIEDAESILTLCEQSRYAGANSGSAAETAQRARALIESLEREKMA